MGSLSELQLPSEEVQVPGTESTISVRGLSLSDCAELLKRHGESLEAVYQKNIASQGDIPPAVDIAKSLMQSAPEAVAELIALANDEPKMSETVRKLPIPVQVEALTRIAILTFHSEAEVKKLIETVIQGSGILTGLMNSLGSPTI